MASKIIFQDKPAYQEGPFALVKDDGDGLWHVYHIQTAKTAMWIIPPFAQKRDALAYVKSLIDSSFKWDVNSDTELIDANGYDEIYTYLSSLLRGMEKK